MSGPWEDFGGTSTPAQTQAAAEGPWQEYLTPTQNTYLPDDQFNKELGDRVYRGESLESIKKWSADNGRDPARLQGLEAAVKYKQRRLPGRSSVANDVVKPPEYDAGHGAFGAGVDGALHSIPYADELGGALDAVIPGQGRSAWETGKGFGEQMDANIDQNRAMAEYDWNHHPYAYGTGMGIGVVGGAVAGGGLVRAAGALPGVVGRGATALGANTAGMNTSRAALAGALYGSDVDNGSFVDRASGAALGAGGGVVGDRVFRGLSRVAQPVVSSSLQAMKDAGIRVTPGQMLGSVGRGAEAIMSHLPFAGNAVKRAQRQSFNDFDNAMVNRTLAPTTKQFIDESTGRIPGTTTTARVGETGRSFQGDVQRGNTDWIKSAREAVEGLKPKQRDFTTKEVEAVVPNNTNTPEATNAILDGLTDSRTGLLRNELNGSSADYEIGKIIDHEILFALDRDEPMDPLKVADVIQNLRAKSKELEYAGLKPSELQDAQGRIGDIEDLFMTHMDNITRPATTRTIPSTTSPIGSTNVSPTIKTASNDVGRLEEAQATSLDGTLFTPQEYMNSTRHFKTSDGPGTAKQLARDGTDILRGQIPQVRDYNLENSVAPGLTLALGTMLHPGAAVPSVLANALYSQTGRNIAEGLFTGSRGRIGDGLSAGFRGAASISPRVSGLGAGSGLSPRLAQMLYRDDNDITPLGE